MNSFRNTILLLFWLTLSCSLFAQYNQWTWVKGTAGTNQGPAYGTQGVANAANHPGTIYEPGEWRDQQGNFWIYSGNDFTTGWKNNLWKYDPSTNMWTWVNGNSTAPAVYGTQGVPALTNSPGGRMAPATWVDNTGKFWMFGGTAGNVINDLWQYDPGTNMWVWMHGSNVTNNPGSYGTKGAAAASNMPPARYETSCTWVDNAGNLWLLGGDRNGPGQLNDLWKYDIGTNMWTWMSGSNLPNQPGVYGTQGVANPANVPGARGVYTSWKDINGNLWLFGGYNNGTSFFNDLWKYDIAVDQWTWMKGSNTNNQAGVYGTKCIPAAGNVPGARMENRTRWTDDCGNFWTFGGVLPGFSDLWRYTVATNMWTWVSGSNATDQLGNYGTQGVSAPANYPRSRGGAVGWKDLSSNFWVFAGAEHSLNATLGDLWRYVPDKPTASFTHSSASGCAPININFTSTSTPGCNEMKSLLWNFGEGANDTSSLANPSNTYTANGTYTISLVVTNCTGGKDSTTQIITINGVMTISLSSTQADCAASNGTATVNHTVGTSPYTYNWNNGQTAQTATGLAAGNYSVTVTDASGCTQTQSVAITANSTLSVTVSSTPSNCTSNDGTATVTPSGGTNPLTYVWNNGQTTQTATGLAAGNYSANITDASGCTATQTVSVTTSGTLSVTIASTPAGCATNDGTATANASGGTNPLTYDWDNGQSTQTATGLSAGNYSVGVTDASGCTATQTVAVNSSNNTLSVTVTSTRAGCTTNDGTATVNPTGGTNPLTYTWDNGQTTQTATGLGVGNYTITVTDVNGCTQTQSVSVTSNSSLSLMLSSTPTGCTVNNGTGTANASNGSPGYTYSWSDGQTSQTATGLAPGTYTATVTDAGGCTQTQTVAVTSSNNNLSVTATSTPAGCTVNNGTATANVSGGTGPFIYAWNNGQTTQAATGLAAGTYTATVTDVNGCTQTQTINVTQTPGPIANITASPSTIALGGSTILTVTGGVTYQWSPTNDLSNSNSASPTASPDQTTTYCVLVTDNNGCQDSTCITITVEIPCGTIYIPNAFTPNNDTENDLECVFGSCIETFHISIYNRWGEKVFESNDKTRCWDGTHNGKLLNTAVFDYYMEATLTSGEKIIEKGNISLIQ